MVLVMEYPHKENVLKLTVNDYDKIVMEIINSMVLDIGKLILMVMATGNMKKMTFRKNGYPTKDVKKKKR